MDAITLATVASAIIAGIALIGGGIAWAIKTRRDDLRRDEVAVWASNAIRAMQSVVVLCAEWGPNISDDQRENELNRLAVELSYILEQGRLYFKNEDGEWGKEKPFAYRGYRPKILDEVLISFLVASKWAEFGADQPHAAKVIEQAEKRFLSMVQKEVGRDKTVDDYNKTGGENIDIYLLIKSEKKAKPSP